MRGLIEGIGGIIRFIFAFAVRAGGPWVLLALILFAIGLALVLLGFDLGEVDAWIEERGLIEAVVDVVMRIVCGLILLICLLTAWAFVFDRKNPERPGFGCLLLAVLVGYFAWVGLTMPAP